MKYLLTIFISILFAFPAYAAIRVEGSVPEFKPLQAAPTGIAPNFQNNANSMPVEEQIQQEEKRQAELARLEEERDDTGSGSILDFGQKGGGIFGKVAWAVLLLVIVAVGWLALKELRKNGKN